MSAELLNPMRGILLKLLSVVFFVAMQTCIKAVGDAAATGQITFYRSAFAMVPIFSYLAYRGALRTAFATANPAGHLKRGVLGIVSMGLGFYGLVLLPLPEAIAIGYAMPLLAVVFAALLLHETVRVYRWTAVFFGMVGVMIISWPKLTLFQSEGFGSLAALGVLAVLASATLGALAQMQVRQLVGSEKTATIVLYFSLTAAVFSLATIPFGWPHLSWNHATLLIASGFLGGAGQILLTESYRQADVSTVAPFDYSSILLGIAISYFLFDEAPTLTTIIGTVFVVSAGIFIIYREHKLGLERRAAREAGAQRV
ncbi:DMT family transporter [Rhizobium sp. NRK18]|uniref:DMT family transporter n=1 Tax=Rhizobium sp. NRK18 TaxID=2964667 RepID=UPI0021C46BB1|nr:DMT family transporter [Rhizobium sp. NRK18]MCQ2004862.1 DMT family transporter [Rhizobium sp. NRK18]